MSTPIATVADALIAFIMSLLRDPAAVEEFAETPHAMMAKSGVGEACLADVKAVKPVIVDRPDVALKTVVTPVRPVDPRDEDDVVREISRIVNQFTTTIDARSTIIDQSVNQNIWTNGGDVTQIFDQDSVVASGDNAVAAGNDATVDNSSTDTTMGDVSIGNTTNDGSNNTTVTGATAATPVADDDAAAPATETDDAEDTAAALTDVADVTDGAVGTTGDAVQPAATDAATTEPAADPMEGDLTTLDTYDSEDPAGGVVDDAYIEEPVEEQ